MEEANLTLMGTTPMLMHADNIEWADLMDEWKNNPENKARSKAGDDRTPPWRWIGCLNYTDPANGVVAIPTEYIMASMMGGAAQVPTGRGKGTFKAQSQSGVICSEFSWPLLISGKPIQMKAINEMKKLKTFNEHKQAAQNLGFSLFVKRAAVGASKHVRVRPRFDNWSVSGLVTIIDDQITKAILNQFLYYAGKTRGLADWRPGSPRKPGPWGMFAAEVS